MSTGGKVMIFHHQAMASPWELMLCGVDEATAAWAARRFFREVDELENELSRFRTHSDIGRINTLSAGERTRVGAAAMDCLLLAADVHEATGGAFDVALGALSAVWGARPGITPPRAELKAARAASGMHLLDIDVATFSVGLKADGVVVDLGGIGKGYAADQAAERIREEYEVGNLLVNAGDSTVLALGAGPEGKGWPVSVGGARVIDLQDAALSGSGVAMQGTHILDPRKGRPTRKRQVHVRARLASVADAFSTAFLVLSKSEILDVCARHPEIEWLGPK